MFLSKLSIRCTVGASWIIVIYFALQSTPSQRPAYRCGDVGIARPKRNVLVGDALNVIVEFGGTWLALAWADYIAVRRVVARRLAMRLWISSWSAYYGALAHNCLSNAIKLVVARPRPDYLAVCRPNVSQCVEGELVENYRCDGA